MREGDHLEDLGVLESIMLKWIFKNRMTCHGLVCSGSGYRQVVDSCECGNEFWGAIKCGEFLD
jgi:hypothetical protein